MSKRETQKQETLVGQMQQKFNESRASWAKEARKKQKILEDQMEHSDAQRVQSMRQKEELQDTNYLWTKREAWTI
jgi:hypothetical protein